MRKAILIAIISLILLSNIAAYSIAVPEKIGAPYTLISDDGSDVLSLDNTVWYRKWHGLLIEQMDSSIYMVTDSDGNALVIAANEATPEKLENAMRFYDVATLLYSGMEIIDADALSEEGITQALLMDRLSQPDQVLYEEKGIAVSYIHPGDVIGIEDGIASVEQNGEDGIIVICPHCGSIFTVFPEKIIAY